MLTIQIPQILDVLETHKIGILPLIREDGKLFLIFKLTKEGILAAKINRGFKISFVPYSHTDGTAYAILLLLMDNDDEPLSITNTFFKGESSNQIIKLLEQGVFDIYFFDELNRELLGYSAKVSNQDDFKKNRSNYLPIEASKERSINVLENINEWFFEAPEKNIKHTYLIEFSFPLYPENFHFLDTTRIIGMPFEKNSILHYSLEREEPGHFQEMDILCLLKRIFTFGKFHLNPIRADNKKEFVDILLTTEKIAILVQAKDSPNTEKTLKTSIDRKKSKTLSHFSKAVRQLEGAINYTKNNESLKLNRDEKTEEVSVENKKLYGLIVVKELFPEDFGSYTNALLELSNSTNTPCLVFDYAELHSLSEVFDEDQFEETLKFIHTEGKKTKIFPRIRILNS